MKLLPWLRLFRIVNLPTVPGDVLVGASVVGAFSSHATGMSRPLCFSLVWAVVASCGLYLYGLADNDIVGAKKDGSARPIPAGEISMGAARFARALCLLTALFAGSVAHLPSAWWVAAFLLCAFVVMYNRAKKAVLMGLCRGLNVLCGGLAVLPRPLWAVAGVALLWTIYIGAVTKYSEGEDKDPAKKQCVGFLIGALVYLQLLVLLVTYLSVPNILTRGTLLGGAAMLLALRFLKRVLPKVSAS